MLISGDPQWRVQCNFVEREAGFHDGGGVQQLRERLGHLGAHVGVIGFACAVTLTGCYGPDGTVMVVHRGTDGSLTFTVPVCEDDTPLGVTVSAADPASGDLKYWPVEGKAWRGGEMEFVVSAVALRDGTLADFGLRQVSTWGVEGVGSIDELDWVYVSTSIGDVAVDPRMIPETLDAYWVVRGERLEGESPGSAVSAAEAQVALDSECH